MEFPRDIHVCVDEEDLRCNKIPVMWLVLVNFNKVLQVPCGSEAMQRSTSNVHFVTNMKCMFQGLKTTHHMQSPAP